MEGMEGGGKGGLAVCGGGKCCIGSCGRMRGERHCYGGSCMYGERRRREIQHGMLLCTYAFEVIIILLSVIDSSNASQNEGVQKQ